MTTKERLEERLGGAALVLAECEVMLQAAARAAVFAERTGHTSLVGEVSAVRRMARTARRKATIVRDRLIDRIKVEG